MSDLARRHCHQCWLFHALLHCLVHYEERAVKKIKPIKKPKDAPKTKSDDLDTPGDFDKEGIYRLGIPMESYDIVRHYQKLVDKIANFIDDVVPMLSEGSYLRKSILRILSARGQCNSTDWAIDSFVMELQHFQMDLAQGFAKINWIEEGEKVARSRLHKAK